MEERLIFGTLTEKEATRELLRDNWPQITIFSSKEEPLVLEIHLEVPAKLFFKWAYTTQLGQPLLHCYHLSLELFDPPAYMREALREIQDQKLLSE